METMNDDDLLEWFMDLTIEQRRAAFEAWRKSPIQAIHISVDNTTHSQVANQFDINDYRDKEHEAIRKQLASKVVWDQDRFPREKAMDEA